MQQQIKDCGYTADGKKLSAPRSQRRGSGIIGKNDYSARFVRICAKNPKNKTRLLLVSAALTSLQVISLSGTAAAR